MALVVKDRVKETTTSTGTGTITLAGATQGYQSFSVVGDGNTTYYTITDGTNWEVGIGTYTASGTTLSRDTILESSNSGSAVNFSAGVKDVFVTYPAEKAVTLDGTETLTNKTINASNNTVTNVSLTTGVTGTLPVANGGTGATSLTSGYVLKGNGTSPVSASVIYDSGTNVGIGTTSPAAKFVVSNASAAGLEVNPTGGVGGGATIATYNRSTSAYTSLTTYASTQTWYANGSIRAIDLDSSGRVGIGTVSPSQTLQVQGTGYATSDFRAPIFYDSDNTAYYLDPNSTSVLNELSVVGNISVGNTAGEAQNAFRIDGYNNDLAIIGSSGAGATAGTSISFRTAPAGGGELTRAAIDSGGNLSMYGGSLFINSGGYIQTNAGGVKWDQSGVRSWSMFPTSGSIVLESGDGGGAFYVNPSGGVRAPIFYDSANTAYYVDPANTGTSLVVAGGAYAAGQVRATGWWGSASGSATALGVEIGQSGGRGYVLSYNRDTAAYGPVSFEATDFTFTGVSGGYAQIDTSFRAPIFYDSGNTAYYVDAASTSSLGSLLIGYSGSIYSYDAAATGKLYFGSTQTDSSTNYHITTNMENFGGSYSKLDFRWYTGQRFYAHNLYGGFRFKEITTGGTLFSVGEGDLNVRVTNALYTPIVYDSNNTGNYLDPAGTSQLVTVQTSGGSGFRSFATPSASVNSQLYFADAGNTRAWNWQLDENNDAALWNYNGSAWSKRVTVTTGSEIFLRNSFGNDLSLAYPSVFGYSSAYRTTVIGNQAYNTVCIGVSPASNASGSFNGNGEGREVMFRNGVNFITPNSANNSYLNPLNMTDGYVSSSGSFRAPIFYDSNNTAYYVDPASGSRLGGQVLFDGGTAIQGNGDVYSRRSSGATGVYYFADGGSKYLYWDGGAYFFGSAGYTQSDVSMRAPIFYDSQNTGYYLDPNGTSNINAANGMWMVGTVNAADIVDGSTWYGLGRNNVDGWSTGAKMVQLAGYFGIRLRTASYNLDVQGSSGIPFSFSGYGQFAGSVRAPIFYDSDNTGYYVDPLSGSNLNGTLVNNGGTTMTAGWNRNTMLTSTFPVLVFNSANTKYSGIGVDYSTPSAGFNFWVNGSSSDLTGTGTLAMNIHQDAYVTALSSFRAPIFYDSDNTGRYLDPSAFTNLGSANFNGSVAVLNNNSLQIRATNNAYQRVDSRVESTNYARAHWYGVTSTGGTTNFRHAWYDGSDYFNVTASGGQIYFERSGGATINATGDFRAPIFYDSNDTSYYCDPNARSRFVAIDTTGGTYNVFRTWTDLTGFHGFYSSVHNGAHFYPNNGSYGSWKIDGSRNGWGGLEFGSTSNGAVSLMIGLDSNTTGFHNNSYGWQFRWNNGTLFCHKGTYGAGTEATVWDSAQGSYTASSDFRAPIFYDSNNTAFYADLSSTAANAMYVAGGIHVSGSNVTGNGIILADDGDIVDLNDGYCAMRFSNGVRVHSGNRTGGAAITLASNGSITATGNVTAYSDIRVKDNVEQIGGALDRLQAIRGVTYTRNDLEDKERRYAGVIAQEIEKVLPEAIFESDDRKAVDYNATIGLLIEAIKELKAEVETLKKG